MVMLRLMFLCLVLTWETMKSWANSSLMVAVMYFQAFSFFLLALAAYKVQSTDPIRDADTSLSLQYLSLNYFTHISSFEYSQALTIELDDAKTHLLGEHDGGRGVQLNLLEDLVDVDCVGLLLSDFLGGSLVERTTNDERPE